MHDASEMYAKTSGPCIAFRTIAGTLEAHQQLREPLASRVVLCLKPLA